MSVHGQPPALETAAAGWWPTCAARETPTRPASKGIGRDEVVTILTRHTPLKDPSVYRDMVPGYINPNGYSMHARWSTTRTGSPRMGTSRFPGSHALTPPTACYPSP